MLTFLLVGALFPAVVLCVSVTQSLADGVCLCVTEPNVDALRDPTNPTSVITTISNGMCFTSHGGIYNKNDVTFYQLRDDKNGQTAWIDSFYLSIEPMNHCNASAVIKGLNYHVPDGPPANCVAYGRTYAHGEQATVNGTACTCDDGVLTCSLSGQHCFSDGLVFQHGTSFDITGHGTCTCSHGTLNCGGLAVGK